MISVLYPVEFSPAITSSLEAGSKHVHVLGNLHSFHINQVTLDEDVGTRLSFRALYQCRGKLIRDVAASRSSPEGT